MVKWLFILFIFIALLAETEPENRKGYVKEYYKDKKYGYIMDIKTEKVYFVHRSGLIDEVSVGDTVTYNLKRTPRGYVAINVRKYIKH